LVAQAEIALVSGVAPAVAVVVAAAALATVTGEVAAQVEVHSTVEAVAEEFALAPEVVHLFAAFD